MKKLALLFIVLLVSVAVACETCDPVQNQNQQQGQAQYQDQIQVQKMDQTQTQTVNQNNNQNVNLNVDRVLDVGDAQVYSRLVYPGEVLTFPVKEGQKCSVKAAYPVGFYTIGSMGGESDRKVQTLEAIPEYDPVYHHMVFGYVPVVDKIDYWTMKADLTTTQATFLVLDNRAPGNDYNTVEVSIG